MIDKSTRFAFILRDPRWRNQIRHEVSNLLSRSCRQKCIIRVVEYFLCANFDPSLFISSKVSYCRNSLSAFYSLFYSRIELDQFPARKSDRNDIESLSSRATSSFCACYVRKSWTPSPWTHDRKSISSTNYTGIVDYEGNSIEISIVSVQNRGNNDDTRVFLFF